MHTTLLSKLPGSNFSVLLLQCMIPQWDTHTNQMRLFFKTTLINNATSTLLLTLQFVTKKPPFLHFLSSISSLLLPSFHSLPPHFPPLPTHNLSCQGYLLCCPFVINGQRWLSTFKFPEFHGIQTKKSFSKVSPVFESISIFDRFPCVRVCFRVL